METITTAVESSRKSAGRAYFWLGLVTSLLGPAVYVGQFAAKHLTVPWHLPILGTVGTILVVLALVRARTVWRFLALGLLGLLAAGEWAFVLVSKLPAYAGPVAVGQAFPAFASALSDGSPFTEASLKGDHKTVLVFFRGRW
jgi:hypothetical protein